MNAQTIAETTAAVALLGINLWMMREGFLTLIRMEKVQAKRQERMMREISREEFKKMAGEEDIFHAFGYAIKSEKK